MTPLALCCLQCGVFMALLAALFAGVATGGEWQTGDDYKQSLWRTCVEGKCARLSDNGFNSREWVYMNVVRVSVCVTLGVLVVALLVLFVSIGALWRSSRRGVRSIREELPEVHVSRAYYWIATACALSFVCMVLYHVELNSHVSGHAWGIGFVAIVLVWVLTMLSLCGLCVSSRRHKQSVKRVQVSSAELAVRALALEVA